jgi:AAA domain/Bifunctional DNA primase/polymerase, N-terminal
MPETNLAVALALADAGIPIFPAHVMRRGPSGWLKKPAIKDWRTLATTDETQIQTWWRQFPRAVPGIELEQAGLVVVDPDHHANGPNGEEAFAQLAVDIGGLPEHPTTDTPNGRHHIFAQDGGSFGNSPGGLPPGVDVRGAGGWIVAPGAVRPDGVAYVARQGTPSLVEAYRTRTIPALPEKLADIIRAAGGADAPERGANAPPPSMGEGGRLDVEACLAGMGPNGASVNDIQPRAILSLLQRAMHPEDVIRTVVDATMAMADAAGLGWSRKAEIGYVSDRVKSGLTLLHKEYDPNTGVIPSWLPGEFHNDWADALAQGRRPQLVRNLGGFYVRAFGGANGPEADVKSPAAGAVPRKIRFKLVSFADLRPGPEPLYLVDELIPVAGLVDVWGKAKCYKSFWCLDLMLHVAMGWEYRDRYVRQGAVVYCAFEGAHGYKKRIEALRRHYKRNIAEDTVVPLHVMPGQANLITEHRVLIADITAQLGEVRPAAVVLDTLNKSLVGSENKDTDMGAYVRAAEAIRDAFGCVVIIVHHCGYDDTRPRGHSSLPGAVDAQLAVTREEQVVTVTVEMMRDGPEDTQVVSEAEVIEVGQDQNGKTLTSLVMVQSDAAAAAAGHRNWPRGLAVFHAALKAALTAHGEHFQPEPGVLPVRAVEQNFVREEFYRRYAEAEEDETRRGNKVRQAFHRALGDAQARDIIRMRRTPKGQNMLWLPAKEEE